jgi:hypothetical protein
LLLLVLLTTAAPNLAADPPATEDPVIKRKLTALTMIWTDVMREPAGTTHRKELLAEFMDKSAEYVGIIPKGHKTAGGVWTLRAIASCELGREQEARAAGKAMLDLGMDKDDSELVQRALAYLERKDWLADAKPGQQRKPPSDPQLRKPLASSLGTITGIVRFRGTQPPERPITLLAGDPNCGRLVSGTPTTKLFVVGANGELADVVVRLVGVGPRSNGNSAEPLIIEQKACEFSPYIAAVQTGQRIIIRNSDPHLHNLHADPQVPGNGARNSALLPGAQPVELTFNQPEDFLKLKCDVHPWMFSYITVVDHPFVDVTGRDGTFTIRGVPPGTYTIEARHRRAGSDRRQLEVGTGTVAVEFLIQMQ